MARLRASWRTSLPVVQQPRNPQSESIARSPYQSSRRAAALQPASPATPVSAPAHPLPVSPEFSPTLMSTPRSCTILHALELLQHGPTGACGRAQTLGELLVL